jgi:dephospho-CoA kinase
MQFPQLRIFLLLRTRIVEGRNLMGKSLVIGLTGGIGTGKTTVAQILKELGIKVIHADEIGHQLFTPGSKVYLEVLSSFGPRILQPDGEINRQALGRIVFADQEKRELLNSLTHPAIKARIRTEIKELKAKGKDVVLDLPLLFEAKMEEEVDEIWVVAVSLQTQLTRVMERNALSYAEAMSRINAQLPLAEKIARADLVIWNEGSKEELREKVELLLSSRSRWLPPAHMK